MTASINLGCYFEIDEDGSLKRIKKDFFESDENVTQGKILVKILWLKYSFSEIYMKTPANSDVSGSFFNEGIQNLLMHYGNSVIFDFEYRAFEVNSVSEENEEIFPCWYCYFPFSRKITRSFLA